MNKVSWGKVRAFFDLRTEEGFTLKGFSLVEGINGLFVGFPSKKDNDDEWRDTVWADRELKEKVTQIAVKAYGQEIMTTPQVQQPITSEQAIETSNKMATPPMPEKEDLSTVAPFSDEDIPF